jgi:hypothetical protein
MIEMSMSGMFGKGRGGVCACVTIGRVDHDGIPGHQIVLSPGERKKKKVSQSPQKTSRSVPAKPKPSSSMFDAIFPEVPKQNK